MNRQHHLRLALWGVLLVSFLFFAPATSRAEDALEVIADPLKLLESLEARRGDLNKREEILDIREKDLQRLEEKLAQRIAALEKLREAIQTDLAKEKEIDDANIARLAKIYGSMKVKSAAEGLQSINQETAVKVLKVMSEKVAGKILAKMDGGNAVALANELGITLSEKRDRRQQ